MLIIRQAVISLCSMVVVPAVLAGSYTDENATVLGDTAKDAQKSWYANVGVNSYQVNWGEYHLPISMGGYSGNVPSTKEGKSFDADDWAWQPSVAVGYRFNNSNPVFGKIFGQDNSIELRLTTSNADSTVNENYGPDGKAANIWYITGGSEPANEHATSGTYNIYNSSVSFDQNYQTFGLYYIGHKSIRSLLNSPYVGFDIIKMDQEIDSQFQYTDFISTENTSLDSYYYGITIGDKLTAPFKRHYGVYGDASVSLLGLHTSMDAKQVPLVGALIHPRGLLQEVESTDDTVTYIARAEIGFDYYVNNYQDPNSIVITLKTGVEYWNDLAYVDNPTGPNQQVQIGYDSSTSPYAGLDIHVPLA